MKKDAALPAADRGKAKRIRLKKSVLVKESKKGEVLVLNPATDTFFGASQDCASILSILFAHWRKGLPFEEIQTKLAQKSPSFRKHKFQKEGLQAVLHQLRQLDLIENCR